MSIIPQNVLMLSLFPIPQASEIMILKFNSVVAIEYIVLFFNNTIFN